MVKHASTNPPTENQNEPLQGVIYAPDSIDSGGPPSEHLAYTLVEVAHVSQKSASIEATVALNIGSNLDFLVFDQCKQAWVYYPVKVARVEKLNEDQKYLADLQFLPEQEAVIRGSCEQYGEPTKRSESDLLFLIRSELLDSVPQRELFHLLDCLSRKRFKAGDRIITQGDSGDFLFLVQEGICCAKVEKNGDIHPVARFKRGEVVGEMAVVTGEVRRAHVDAETDMVIWELKRAKFEEMASKHPDLRIFLTELLANRLATSTATSERLIGKYLLKNKIGKGGWSIVYQGVHKTLNRPVAIKMLRHDMAMEPGFIERFRKEAEIIASLRHNNIINVYDIEELFQTVFIMMEYLEGESLEDILERIGKIPIARAVNFLMQTCSGLDYAHGRRIIHRDIKPANIFVQAKDQIKILDFGLAVSPDSDDLNMAGTLVYAPPEEIEGDVVDVRSDIYALGITAYEMVAGCRPYPEDDLAALADMHCHQDIPDPCKHRPELPKLLREFILKACQRDPCKRYQSTQEALDHLQPLADEYGIISNQSAQPKRKMTSIFLFYGDEEQEALTQLLEEFSIKARKLGAEIKNFEIGDF